MISSSSCPRITALASFAAAVIVGSMASAQTIDRNAAHPCVTPIYAGTYHLATGEFTPANGQQSNLLPNPGVIYDNTCNSGYFTSLLNNSTVLDEGRVPTVTSPPPNAGTVNNYRVTGFQVAYCTRDLAGVFGLNMLHWWEREGSLSRVIEPLAAGFESGAFQPVVAAAFPFDKAADAHRFIHERKNVGKVVLVP